MRKQLAKIAIIAVAWMFYLMIASGTRNSTSTDTETRNNIEQSTVESSKNIKGLSFTRTNDITVKVGKLV